MLASGSMRPWAGRAWSAEAASGLNLLGASLLRGVLRVDRILPGKGSLEQLLLTAEHRAPAGKSSCFSVDVVTARLKQVSRYLHKRVSVSLQTLCFHC